MDMSSRTNQKVGIVMKDGVPELSSFFAKMKKAVSRSNSRFFPLWILSCDSPALC